MRDPYQINWDDGSPKPMNPALEMLKALTMLGLAVLITVAMSFCLTGGF
jgi:hypothetical protein